jgi:hypothetical protein
MEPETNQTMCDPTEKTLYQEPHDDTIWTWQDRLYECGERPRKGIGIAVGGTVFVLPLKRWHELASAHERDQEIRKVLLNALKAVQKDYYDGASDSSVGHVLVIVEQAIAKAEQSGERR